MGVDIHVPEPEPESGDALAVAVAAGQALERSEQAQATAEEANNIAAQTAAQEGDRWQAVQSEVTILRGMVEELRDNLTATQAEQEVIAETVEEPEEGGPPEGITEEGETLQVELPPPPEPPKKKPFLTLRRPKPYKIG